MIRTGQQYRESLKDGREIWINGERVKDVATHKAFKPIVDIRARIYDLAHETASAPAMTYVDAATGETNCIGYKLPKAQEDWQAKRRAGDAARLGRGGEIGEMPQGEQDRLRLFNSSKNIIFPFTGAASSCRGCSRERHA